MKRYFIIGTDTNAGKTYVTCQIMNYLKSQGQQVLALKPIASGCTEEDGELQNEDVTLLQRYASINHPEISPWRFMPPISPHLAAQELGEELSVQKIAQFCMDPAFDPFDYLFIESAGGLMSPINRSESWLDVLLETKIPVIFVVGMRLGCLNHAALTAFTLNTHRIPCIGWVANCIDEEMLRLSENIASLSNTLPWPLLATVGFKETLSIKLLTSL